MAALAILLYSFTENFLEISKLSYLGLKSREELSYLTSSMTQTITTQPYYLPIFCSFQKQSYLFLDVAMSQQTLSTGSFLWL